MEKPQQKILIVDDERLNVDILVDLLKFDYKIMVAKNGKQALKAVKSKIPPDLILLDIMMPEMDGYEVCRRIKADRTTRDIPIIFVTAMSETSNETEGLKAGAVDYLTKPISPPIVKARVKTHLDRKRQRDELKQAYKTIESQKERMQEELNIGRDIQMSMVPQTFPPFPDRKEFLLHALLNPAREVGGDFYDFFFIDENHLCLCIGDVSGKGVPAALFMAVARTLIKALASRELSPSGLIERINNELSENNEDCMFVTLFLGILNVETGLLTFTNAGHNPAYLQDGSGNVTLLSDVHGPMVGAMPEIEYEQDRIQIPAESNLILYTDGITEAFNRSNEPYGEDRLLTLLENTKEYDPVKIIDCILNSVNMFTKGAEQSDDITLLCLRLLTNKVVEATTNISLMLKNKLEEIDRIHNKFKTFCNRTKLSKEINQSVSIVLDDLLNNIISYGFQDSEEHIIEVSFSSDKHRLTIKIKDDGVEFDPFVLEEPDTESDIEDRNIGGLGIHLIRSIMDEYNYKRQNGFNHVTLIKKL